MTRKNETSWGAVAGWYDEHLEEGDTYQEKVVLPNLLRILDLKKGERVIDIACGQGYFTRAFVQAGAAAVGADISRELITLARTHAPNIPLHVAPANKLDFATDGSFDTAVIVLAIQNIADMRAALREAARVLAPGGRLVLVINHPAFRIPRRSSWGWDDDAKLQYRRIDGYLSQSSVPIVAHPGAAHSTETLSFHHSLQDFFKALHATGFAVTRLEEWISHKASQRGPRQKAEDAARKEFPLFMMLEARVDKRAARERL